MVLSIVVILVLLRSWFWHCDYRKFGIVRDH